MNEPSDGRTLRQWFTVAVILAVLVAVAMILAPLRKSIAWGAFLGFLLLPLQRRLTRRLGNSPNAAAAVLTGLAPVVLLVPLGLLGVAFAHQIAALVAALQANSALWSLASWQDPQVHPGVAQFLVWTEQRFHISAQEIHQYIVSAVQRYARVAAAGSGQILLDAAGGFLRFFLMLFILFFMLRDGAAWFSRLTELLPLEPPRRRQLLERLARVTRAVVYGCGLTALGEGILVGVAFAIAGLPGPVVFGVLAGLAALLPVGGTALVWVPAAAWLLFADSLGLGIFMLAWGAFLSTADSFVRPAIISHQTPVPTLLVFLGVIGGVTAFGFIGFIFGPVILVLATEMLRFAEGSLARRP